MSNQGSGFTDLRDWSVVSKAFWADSDVPRGVKFIVLLALGLIIYLGLTLFIFILAWLNTEAWVFLITALYHGALISLFLIYLTRFMQGKSDARRAYIGFFLSLTLYFFLDQPLVATVLFMIGVLTALYLLTGSSIKRYFALPDKIHDLTNLSF